MNKLKNRGKGEFFKRFFKTGPGQYGEGDVFLGLTVPQQRIIAGKYRDLSLPDIQQLLDSKIHEFRLTGLFILVDKYKKSDIAKKEKIAKFYLKNAKKINNWDLVDLSADKILGDYLLDRDKSIIYKLAKSENLWEKRISILSTFNFIKNGKYDDALKIYEIHLKDKHELIHKAVGWMLRELGKRNLALELKFLDKHYKIMPRTMLRYSIEKFSPAIKSHFMTK